MTFLFLRSQVCCATSMTPASAIRARRVPTVTPTQSMAKPSAPVRLVTRGQLATSISTNAPLVSCKFSFFRLLHFSCKSHTLHMNRFQYTVNMTTCFLYVAGANPCEHGGRCLNTKGSFQCKCLQGYEGPRCEMDVNECMSNPCHNDATCLDQIGGFHCICMPGRTVGLYSKERERSMVAGTVVITNLSLCPCVFDFRVRGRLLPHQHGRVRQSALSEQRQMHRQDQFLPLRVP